MVGLHIKFLGAVGGGGVGGENDVQQLVHPLVHLGLREGTGLQGGKNLPVAVAAGAGHLQVAARPDRLGVVIGAAPVGDHKAVKAPLLPKYIGEQPGVIVGVGAVNQVVGGHNGLGVALLHRNFKVGEVQLPQGPHIHHAVAGHAQQLLAVGGEVLGAGGDAVFLNAPDESGGHLAREVGVLGVVLKAASAQGVALGVQTRAQQHIDLLAGGLLADGPADLLSQVGVPAVGHTGGGGKASGRLAGVETQVVGGPQLLSNPVGAVREVHSGDVLLGNGVGAPDVPPGQEGHLLF